MRDYNLANLITHVALASKRKSEFAGLWRQRWGRRLAVGATAGALLRWPTGVSVGAREYQPGLVC